MSNGYRSSSPSARLLSNRVKSGQDTPDLHLLLNSSHVRTADLTRAERRTADLLSITRKGTLAATPKAVDVTDSAPPVSIEIPSAEKFDAMAADVKRIVMAWISSTESTFKAAQEEILNEKKRTIEERTKMLKDLEDKKAFELERIKESRLRAEQERASMIREIATEREQARLRLEEEKKKFDAEKESFKRTLRIEQENLKRSQEALDLERKRIVDANIATQTKVELNVGGALFETSRHTLTQLQPDSYLACLFSGRNQVERDRNGRIFIDRDAGLFRTILNFLRDPDILPSPKSSAESDEICREASFYGVKFFPYPLVSALGGHDGAEYLSSCEILDPAHKCWKFTASLETPRAYHAGGALLNKMYAAGGQNFEYKALCDVEVYDALIDQWFPGPPLLYPRKSTSGAVLGERLFVAGGFDGASILNTMEFLDHRVRNWVETAPMKTPRNSATMVARGDHEIVVLGGSTGERLSTGEIYDVRADKWEPLTSDMIEVRSGACGCNLFDSLYILGGVDGAQRVHDSMEMFDFQSQQWGFRKSASHPIVDAAACAVLGSLLVTGGQAHGEVFNDVWFYRPELDEWQQGPDIGQRRFGHSLIFTQF